MIGHFKVNKQTTKAKFPLCFKNQGLEDKDSSQYYKWGPLQELMPVKDKKDRCLNVFDTI